jgi:hypothetical protein
MCHHVYHLNTLECLEYFPILLDGVVSEVLELSEVSTTVNCQHTVVCILEFAGVYCSML